MRRFFVKELIDDKDGKVFITGRELHHLKDVLRLEKGNEVVVFDVKGREFVGKIEFISKKEASVIIEKQIEISKESFLEIILGQGVIKLPKMDIIIQKATELGISKIIPFTADRSLTRLEKGFITKKEERWQNIAIDAAKQCGRGIIPNIERIMTFAEILSGWDKYIKIILWEGETKNTLKDILKLQGISQQGFIILIGPEGGFSDVEIVEAKKTGFLPVSLGPRILKAETAAISAITIIQYEFGDMSKLPN